MSEIILFTLGSSLAIMTVSLIGVLFAWHSLGRWFEQNLLYLVSFSAGVFVFVSYHLLKEAFTLPSNQLFTWLALIFGLIIFWLFDKFLPESHHHHTESDCKHTHSRGGAKKMLFGDAIHNIGDGVIIVPAFMTSIEVGIVVSIGILIHEAIQEISEFFVLRQAGHTTKQALIRNFLVSSTILIGLIIGFILSDTAQLLAPLLALAAGGFIYIILVDLIPPILCHRRHKKIFIGLIVLFFLGLIVSFGADILTDTLGLEHPEVSTITPTN